MDKYSGTIFYFETIPKNIISDVKVNRKTIEEVNEILLDLAREDKTLYGMNIKIDTQE